LKKFVFIACSILVLAACKQQKTVTGNTLRSFPAVQVPGMINDPSERAAFIAAHYWDAFVAGDTLGQNDTAVIAGVAKAEIEQAVSNYIFILDALDIPTAKNEAAKTYDLLRGHDCFSKIISLLETYLYDPNSPLRSEDFFQPIAEKMSRDSLFTTEIREKYAKISANTSLNCIGTPAADFSFSDKKGKMFTLYGIKAEYTILFFSNPGCNACKEIIESLNSSMKVNHYLETGDLAVLNIYIDEDLSSWYEYMPIYPESWHNGFDPNLVIREDKLYDVRAIPSLYLLDSEKRVILKDAPPERLYAYLEQI